MTLGVMRASKPESIPGERRAQFATRGGLDPNITLRSGK